MWGRDKNFQVSMMYDLKNCETILDKTFFYETRFRLSTTGLDNLYGSVQLCTLKYSPSAQVVYSSTVYLYINHVHIFMCVPLI
jgi:hypothetical protein